MSGRPDTLVRCVGYAENPIHSFDQQIARPMHRSNHASRALPGWPVTRLALRALALHVALDPVMAPQRILPRQAQHEPLGPGRPGGGRACAARWCRTSLSLACGAMPGVSLA
jgi:hypothetical protein